MFHDPIVKAWAVLTQATRPARRENRTQRRFTPQVGANWLETRVVPSGGGVSGGIFGPPIGGTNSGPMRTNPGGNS
jgi:hypothetical protein